MSYINSTTGNNILPIGTSSSPYSYTYTFNDVNTGSYEEQLIEYITSKPELLEKLFRAMMESGVYKKVMFEKELKEIINTKD